MFLWRVLFLKAVRIIGALQKAHLREHNDQSKEEDQAWGIVPHDGFVAARAPGTTNSTPAATGRLQGCTPAATGRLQAYMSSCNCQVARKCRGDRTHRERSLPPATVVAKCGGSSPCLARIFLIASWWLHGAHTGALGASFFRGVASGLLPLTYSTDLPLAAIAAATISLWFSRGPPTGSLQQHKGCSSCCNTTVASMHSQQLQP